MNSKDNLNERLYMTDNQIQKLNNMSSTMKKYIQGTFGISILSVIFFKYIPYISTVQSKVVKFIIGLGLLTIPTVYIFNKQAELIRNEK
jgi:hypothetical protein